MSENKFGKVGPILHLPISRYEQDFFFMSDLHIDSIYSNRELILEHLEKAIRRNAIIIMVGDIFDAMQGRFDPRRSMDLLRPEYRASNYFDLVVKDVAKLLSPFARNIALISPGNHESSIRKNNGTDLIERLIYALNDRTGSQIIRGGYGGWIRVGLKPKNRACFYNIKYHHGFGGEAPVTRGVIHTNRQAIYLPDADVVINGHNHNAFILPITRERITNRGNHNFDNLWFLRTPGYLQSYADGQEGWEVERGGVPKPLGAIWGRFIWTNDVNRRPQRLRFMPEIVAPNSVPSEWVHFDGQVFPEE